MNIKRHLEPAGRVLSSTPESKVFVLFSLVIFIFLRLLLLWGYHNLFHMTYLLIAFSFFQTTILSTFIMQNIKDPLTREEHSAMRKSAILLGYIWSAMLYAAVIVIWVVDLWQVQSGVNWPISDFTPDLGLLLLIVLLCTVHFPLTLSALYWQWACFQPRDIDSKDVLDTNLFRTRSIIVFLILGLVFVSFLGLKSSIEGEFVLPMWINPSALALLILLLMTVLTLGFYYSYRRIRA
jgi:hypothetical protein